MHKSRAKQAQGLSWNSLKAEWRLWFADKSPVLAFGVKFGAYLILLYSALALPFADRLLYSYLEANAWVSHLLLNLLWQGTQVTDVTIRSPDFAIAIRRGCDAIEPIGLLCGAIMAFPGPILRRLAGMLAGMLILQTLNLVRIVTLFLIGNHFPAFFPSAHLEIWPTLFILAAIGCFMGWKRWALEK